MENAREVLLEPCHHMVLCVDCLQLIKVHSPYDAVDKCSLGAVVHSSDGLSGPHLSGEVWPQGATFTHRPPRHLLRRRRAATTAAPCAA
jgi:hypothetical protein